ncbi:MAG: hypothetical protein HDR72_01115 [Ruminococcaceae bacterium]|nr:hypothetical protein [Oscillospiraceae bacterium]
MKRSITAILALIMLCGCADQAAPRANGMSGCSLPEEKIPFRPDISSPYDSSSSSTEEIVPVQPEELRRFVFNSAEEVEAISDEDLIYISQNNYSTRGFISDIDENMIDLFGFPLQEKETNGYVYKEKVETFLLSSALPIEELNVNESIFGDVLREACEKHCENLIKSAAVSQGDTGSRAKDEEIIYCGENDLYAEYSIRFTSIKTMYNNNILMTYETPRAYRRLFLKNRLTVHIGERENPVYFGELTLENVKAEMDLMISLDGLTVYREVGETENAYIYTSYVINTIGGDWGLCDRAELRRYDNIFDKTTHEQSSGETCVRSVEIAGTARYWDNEW